MLVFSLWMAGCPIEAFFVSDRSGVGKRADTTVQVILTVSRVSAQCINRINVYLLNNVCITFSLYVENELVL